MISYKAALITCLIRLRLLCLMSIVPKYISPELNASDAAYYQSLVGILRWIYCVANQQDDSTNLILSYLHTFIYWIPIRREGFYSNSHYFRHLITNINLFISKFHILRIKNRNHRIFITSVHRIKHHYRVNICQIILLNEFFVEVLLWTRFALPISHRAFATSKILIIGIPSGSF